MGHGRISLDIVSAAPKKKITGRKLTEFKRIRIVTEDCPKISRFPDPDILSAGVPGNVLDPVLTQDKINEAGTIHSAIRRISRAVGVIEIARGQGERIAEKFAHRLRIFVVTPDFVRRNRGHPAVRRWARGW